ncbi:MAG: peptidoglycan D,D-transpeptidase FtsI family protein [Ignavibacteriales bacterium]
MHLIHRRITSILILLCVLLLFFVGRFFVFQVIKGPEIASQASAMRTRGFSLPEADRGRILDRNYRDLTGQQEHWACFCMPLIIQDVQATAKKVAPLLDMSEQLIEKRIREAQKRRNTIILLKEPLYSSETRIVSPPGIIITPISRRYQDNGFLIHLLGHLGEEAGKRRVQVRGDAGLEARYEQDLRVGSYPAQVAAVVDGRGQIIPGLSPKIATAYGGINSRDVVTTIDKDIQLITERSMDRHVTTGAVVVMEIKNRDVLAIASRPKYNPNQPASYLAASASSPLLNRALESFPPGSLFKIMVAAAALETGVVSAEDQFFCRGAYSFSEDLSIPCWKKTGHGRVSIGQALSESCNTAFIEMGLRVGRSGLLEQTEYMKVFDHEIIGYSDAQENSGFKIDYGRAALGNASLGQAGVMMTPLQAANMMATVVDNGLYKHPRIVKEVRQDDSILRSFPADQGIQVLSPSVSLQLRDYLRKVTTSGTGQLANIETGGCGGKTATSQTGQFTAEGEEILDTWFVGFFPANQPRWVISVLVEHGQSGGHNAAPVFKEIAEQIVETN